MNLELLTHHAMQETTSTERANITSPQLAALLDGYRDEVVASWVRLLISADDTLSLDCHRTRYRERPVTELQASARACIVALADLFRSGSYDSLADYTEHTCQVHVGQGFDIAEVLEGHLLLRDAVLLVIHRECAWDTSDQPALAMIEALDTALRWLVLSISKHYSLALNAQLTGQVSLLEQQRQQLERRVREVSALVRSSTLITSTLNLDRVLSLILEQLAEVVQYDRASIMMLFERRLKVIAGGGFDDLDEVIGLAFDPRENALTWRLLHSGEPIVLQDVRDEPHFVSTSNDPTRSWIGVPLMVRNQVIGALAIDKNEPAFYDDEDGQTVLAFANQAAIAIENAQLYDKSREQDILEERNRLARELHDSLSQALFSMVLNAEAAKLFFDTDPEKARQQMDLLYETANAALKEMRSLIFELRPANLEQEGLAAVLTKHAKMTGERHGIKVRVEVKGQRRLPLQIEKALYRVAQEAMNNVVKHAGASEALITLSSEENWIKMVVQDNGVGIPQGAPKPNTLGLTSMRERVEELGGTFEIGLNPADKGTQVTVRVPCDGL